MTKGSQAHLLLFGFLLFGHQAVGPYRTNTACAPMAAYTWTPSRNPAARIPPVPCVLNKALLLGDIAGPTLFSVIGTPPWKGGTWRVVLVFFINPIGASELTRGVSSSNLGTNPSTTPFFERGLHLNSSRWFYRTPPTLVGRLQLSPA